MTDETNERAPAGSVSRRHGPPPWQVEAGERTSLHVVVEGSFHLTRDATAIATLAQGDVVLVAPHSHGLRSLAGGASGRAELLSASYDAAPAQRLPPVVHLAAADVQRSSGLSTIVTLLRAALAEPGESRELARSLLTPLLAYTLHCHDTRERPTAPTHDRRIARALELMRARPTDRWTVAALARAAGLSRAAFARRFLAELGVPPLRHLTELRMRRAAQRLAESDASLAAIAAGVGYDSEFAFSRAFKRHMGEPPGSFRRRVRAEGTFGPQVVCMAA